MMKRENPVMTLDRLLADFVYFTNGENVALSGIETDSRRVQQGDLFIACSVCGSDDEKFVAAAVQAGAAAVLVETADSALHGQLNAAYSIPVVGFYQLSDQAGVIASRFYGDPSKALDVIGVTGTNGKTSCTQLIAQALSQQGSSCGLVGTLGSGVWGALEYTGFTTPQAAQLQRNLYEMADQVDAVAIEVSSHALDQGRVNQVAFDIAVLTNLSRDHLDYHGDMQAYQLAKAKLFGWAGLKAAVLNLDDSFGTELMAQASAEQCYGYRITPTLPTNPEQNVIYAQIMARDLAGVQLAISSPWGQLELQSPLLGEFNVSNLLAVFTVLMIQGYTLEQARSSLEQVTPPAGRMECYKQTGRPLVVIDYAHTPDALAQVLMTLRQHCAGTLRVVFGCGGDRDRGKRAEMGAVAEQYADDITLTNDNPRTEDPVAIVADIRQGITEGASVRVELDRDRAITVAIEAAGEHDIVLVAGKGHEDYQIVGTQKLNFSDQAVVQRIYSEAA